MYKQMYKILAVAAILALSFWLTKGDWRKVRVNFLGAGDRSYHTSEEFPEVSPEGADEVPADSASLEELLRFITESGLDVRLQQWSDSVVVIERQLEAYRELLKAFRESVRTKALGEPSKLREFYFRAVRALRGFEGQSRELDARLDTLRTLITAIERAGRQNPKLLLGNLEHRKPDSVRWLMPTRVPIKQACLSCHPPLGGVRVASALEGPVSVCPEVMIQHPPEEFGCTICHRGEPERLDFETAHGPDELGRPFLTGRLALRSCGFCHSRTTVPLHAAAPVPWPEDCLGCHQKGEPEGISVDSFRTLFADSLADEQQLRAWLLRHWSDKTGRLPERKQFEQTLPLLSAGERGTESPFDSSAAPEGKTACRCPRCGRIFEVLPGVTDPVCPVDGTALLPARR